MRKIFTSVSILLLSLSTFAQLKTPSASPSISIKQEIGLTSVELSYSRPSVKDRAIFGAIVPYGEVWRTGANACTKITFADDIEFGGHPVPKGTYSIYTIPNKDKWTVILNLNTKLWGAGGYSEKEDFLRFDIVPEHTKKVTETFTIDTDNYTANSTDLVIKWEHVLLRIPMQMDTDSKVFTQIRKLLIESKEEQKAGTYYKAAMYYYDKKVNMDQALQWMDKAVAKNPTAFWYQYFYAEMLLDKGKKDKANSVATSALEMAKKSEQGDYGYIAKLNLLLQKING